MAWTKRRGRSRIGLAGLLVLILAAAVLRLRSDGAGPLVGAVSLDQQPISALIDERSGRAFVLTADGTGGVFPGDSADPHGNGQVRVFDTATGTLVHVENAGDRPCAIVAARRAGRVFVAYGDATTSGGAVLMLDATSGNLLGTIRTGAAQCGGAPVVDRRRGRAFFAGSDDSLNTIDAGAGRLINTAHASGDSGVRLAIDERDGRVFAALTSGGVIDVFDAPSGRRLRPIVIAAGDEHRLLSPVRDAKILSYSTGSILPSV